MNYTINKRIIKYIELIDENIIIMDNYINITENTTCQLSKVMHDDVIRNIFKSSINILKSLYYILIKEEEFMEYHSGLLMEINLFLKKVCNNEMIYMNTIEFIKLLKYIIKLTQNIKTIAMPLEELVSIYPELSSLSKFHNLNFYRLFILAYKIDKDFPENDHVFIDEEKDNHYLLKKFNTSNRRSIPIRQLLLYNIKQ